MLHIELRIADTLVRPFCVFVERAYKTNARSYFAAIVLVLRSELSE